MGKKNKFFDIFGDGPYYLGEDIKSGVSKYRKDRKSFRRHNMVKNIIGAGLTGTSAGIAAGKILYSGKDKGSNKALYAGAIGSILGSGAGYLLGRYENNLIGDYAKSSKDK